MAYLDIFVRLLITWMFDNNCKDLLSETTFWPVDTSNIINSLEKIRYLFDTLINVYEIPNQMGMRYWDTVAKGLHNMFRCNVIIYADSSNTPLASKEKQKYNGTLEITTFSSATASKEYKFR